MINKDSVKDLQPYARPFRTQHNYPPCTACLDDSYDVQNSNILYYLIVGKISKRIDFINDPSVRLKIRNKIRTSCKKYYKVRTCNLTNYHLYYSSNSGDIRIPMLKQTLSLLQRFHHGQNLDQLIHNDEEQMKNQIKSCPYYSFFLERYIYKFLTTCQTCRRGKVLKIPQHQDYFQDIYRQIDQIEQNRLTLEPQYDFDNIQNRNIRFDPNICFYNCKKDSYDENWQAVLRYVGHNMLPNTAYQATYQEKSQITRTLQAKKKKMIIRKCSRGTQHIWKLSTKQDKTNQLRIPMCKQTMLLLKILHGQEHRNLMQMLELLRAKTYYSPSDTKKFFMKKLDFCEKCGDFSQSSKYSDYIYTSNGQFNPFANRDGYIPRRRGRRGRRPRNMPRTTYDDSSQEKFEPYHLKVTDQKQRQRLNVMEQLRQYSIPQDSLSMQNPSNKYKIAQQINTTDDMAPLSLITTQQLKTKMIEYLLKYKNKGIKLEQEDISEGVQHIKKNQQGLNNSCKNNRDYLLNIVRKKVKKFSSQEIKVLPISTSDNQNADTECEGLTVLSAEMLTNYIHFGQTIKIQYSQKQKWSTVTLLVQNNRGSLILMGIICLSQKSEQLLEKSIRLYFQTLISWVNLKIGTQISNLMKTKSICINYNPRLLQTLYKFIGNHKLFEQTIIMYKKQSLTEPKRELIIKERNKSNIQSCLGRLSQNKSITINKIQQQLKTLDNLCGNKQIPDFYCKNKSLFFRQYHLNHCFFGSNQPFSYTNYQRIINDVKQLIETIVDLFQIVQIPHQPYNQNQAQFLDHVPIQLRFIYQKIPSKIFKLIINAFTQSKNLRVSEDQGRYQTAFDLTIQTQFRLKYLLQSQHWVCSCNHVYHCGIPCSHLIAIVLKYGGQIGYYVSSRWSKLKINELSQ